MKKQNKTKKKTNKKKAALKCRFVPEWSFRPYKFRFSNILGQRKVLIKLSEMWKSGFSNKWSVTQKAIMVFNL